MMTNRMICRSSATQAGKPAPRIQSTGSMWAPDEDVPRSKVSRVPGATSGATLASIVDEFQTESLEVPTVYIERPTLWFDGPVAELPRWTPYISPDLVALAAEDE